MDIFSIADNVVQRLQENDPVLHNHLVETMKQNVAFNPREFLVNFMHYEKKNATGSTMANNSQDVTLDGDNEESKSLLTHPIVFIRKWISEASIELYLIVIACCEIELKFLLDIMLFKNRQNLHNRGQLYEAWIKLSTG